MLESMGLPESNCLCPEGTAVPAAVGDVSSLYERAVRACLSKQCGNGWGQAFPSKMENGHPWNTHELQQRGGAPQCRVGAEQLLGARHTWVGDRQQEDSWDWFKGRPFGVAGARVHLCHFQESTCDGVFRVGMSGAPPTNKPSAALSVAPLPPGPGSAH